MHRPFRFPAGNPGALQASRSGSPGMFGTRGVPNALPQTSTRSGLLSKLFGRQAASPQAADAVSAFARVPQAGPAAQGLAGGDKIQAFLSNTQSVLNTAQKFGPVIEQYGPMVKNLPAMWKLYKGMKNLPDTETDQTAPTVHQTASSEEAVQELPKTSKETRPKRPGPSLPKMYV